MKLKKISIVGRPNVGKSTLFNAITGCRKALTSKTPGTTRDRIEAVTTVGKKQFVLSDTGGFDDDKEQLKSLVREQTLKAVNDSDILIFLIDGRDGLLPIDRELADLLRKSGKTIIPAVNKADVKIAGLAKNEFFEIGFDDFFFISAQHRIGIEEILSRIEELLEENIEEDSASPDSSDAVKISILGRPNVGKSSLVNKLLGRERVIVSEIPGTTIDSIDIMITSGKKKFMIVDNPGIRKKRKITSGLEKESSFAAIRSIRKSDISILVTDMIEGVTDQDLKIANLIHNEGRGFILLCNKSDLFSVKKGSYEEYCEYARQRLGSLDYAVIHFISAKTGHGVEKIFPESHALFGRLKTEFPTAALNDILRKVETEHHHPMSSGRFMKLKYIHQLSGIPPLLQIFANQPEGIEKNYVRFIEKKLRREFNLDGVPLKFRFRKGDNPFIHR